jgi:hypothetical protein
MESNAPASCPAFPSLQPAQSGDAIQPLDDADVRAETAVLVTHGALLKSYDANKKSMLPVAMLITPMAPQPSLVLHREPPRCRTCGAAFSFASAFGSFQQMRWHCAFCHSSNSFTSASYSQLPEYSPAMSCVEYTESHINTKSPAVLCAPTVVFCVDGNLRPREMLQVHLQPQVYPLCVHACVLQLKDALVTALQSLPPDFVVGFIVFGSSVRVYRLNHEKEVMHADVIGGRAYPTKQQLGILSKQVRVRAAPSDLRLQLYYVCICCCALDN